METLQKWFGFGNAKSSDSATAAGITTSISNPKQVLQDRATAANGSASGGASLATKHTNEGTTEMVQEHAVSKQPIVREPETRVGQLVNQGRELILRVVPLTEGDCLSCKIIGSGAMWGAAAFVLLSYPKVKARYTGFRRKLVIFQVGSLATSLTLLGAARFFDLSIFASPDTEGKRKSFAELLREDVDNMYKYSTGVLSADSAESESSDSKKGS